VPKSKKIFYGWWIVLAAAAMHLFGGGTFYYGFTVFFNPIRNTFGWTAAVTSIAFTLQRLESGIIGPIAGVLVDRIGPRKLMLTGWVIVGLGFLLMSRVASLWSFYSAFLLIAIGTSLASGLVSNVAIANWFSKKRSRALAITFIGPGVSGLMAPLLALLLGKFGWRETLVMVAIALPLLCLPLSLVMRHKPGQYGYLPDGETPTTANKPAGVTRHDSPAATVSDARPADTGFTVRAVLRMKSFWLIAFASFFQQVGTSALMVHIVPYLESVRVPTAIAAMVVTGITLASLFGRLGFGLLGDFANKRYLIAIGFVLQTVGLFLFSLIVAERAWLIIPFLLTYGPGYGAPIPLRPALQADYFGTRSFGVITGLMALISMVGGLASPVVAGWIFDTTGSYRLAWQLFTLVTLPAIPFILLARPPKTQMRSS